MTTTSRWRRSSRSINGSECVELAHTLDAVRDSKNPGITLTVLTLAPFIAFVRGGR